MKKYEHFTQFVFWALFAYGAAYLAALWISSFSIQRSDDVSFMYYLSWLINEKGYSPYKDILDTSFPGTFLLHSVIANVFGYTDIAFHMADTLYLAALMITTWLLLKPVHQRVAIAATLMVGLYYFSTLSSMRFQRDYLCILPISLALLLARDLAYKPSLQAIGIGVLVAISASVKPQYLATLPAIYLAAAIFSLEDGGKLSFKNEAKRMAYIGVGLTLWITCCTIWLLSKGAIVDFYNMATQLLPLYMNLDGSQSEGGPTAFGIGFLASLFETTKKEWGMVLLTALYVVSLVHLQKKQLALFGIILLLVMLAFWCVLAGRKGWDYHWMPFYYFSILASSFVLVLPPLACLRKSVLFVLGIAVFCLWHLNYLARPETVLNTIKHSSNPAIYPSIPSINTRELTDYLGDKVRPGEKVEIRVTGTAGAFFPTLLELQLVPATRYQLQLMHYRNTASPYIQGLRRDLLKQLDPPPRYLLDDNQFSLLAKPDGSPGWPEYDEFIKKNYRLVYDNTDRAAIPNQFLVYERIN